MKMQAYNPGACGMVQMFHAGTVNFDTKGIADGAPICTVPKGTVVLAAVAVVTTAFDAGTTNVLTVGTKDDKDAILAAADITEGTAGNYRKDTFVKLGSETEIYAQFTQTGTAATAGSADVYIMAVTEPTT